jgi:hypothetical protein
MKLNSTVEETVTISDVILTYSGGVTDSTVPVMIDDLTSDSAYVIFDPMATFKYDIDITSGIKSGGLMSINCNNQNLNGLYKICDTTQVKQYLNYNPEANPSFK